MRSDAMRYFLAALISLQFACSSDDDPSPAPGAGTPAPAPTPAPTPAPAPAAVGEVVALTASNRIISFDRATPGTIVSNAALSGLTTGESLLGIDVRPSDGQVYAVGNTGRIYVLDPATGALTPKATLTAASGDDAPFTALPAGDAYGVDFNPVADRLRLVGSSGIDLRINVDTGAAITDGEINGGPSGTAITASAYTDSFAGTTATQLYAIDAQTGTLFLQNPPNDGTLSSPIALGVTGGAANGFDVDSRTGAGVLALGNGSTSTLYRVDVSAASDPLTPLGAIGGGEAVTALALRQAARPTAWGLLADNRLVSFDPAAPGTITATRSIGGLAAAERVVGIDFRPANGTLYALTDAARIYTIDATTGAATLSSTLTASQSDATAPYASLDGTILSVDFNPVADRMRVVSDTGQNLRINVETGETITDGNINRATSARVVGAAYTNSFPAPTATTLYDLDAATDVLATQTPPNDGTLVDVGALGVDLNAATAFDIAGGGNGLALAAVASASGASLLYGVNLATGAMMLYRNASGDPAASQIGGAGGAPLIDLAIELRAN